MNQLRKSYQVENPDLSGSPLVHYLVGSFILLTFHPSDRHVAPLGL